MIDLHTHTTASDGSFSPKELIRLAKRSGLTGIAVTDHDTTDGIAEARAEAEQIGLPFIPGIEISAEYSDQGTMHILGYFIDETDASLKEALNFLKESRRQRNPKMIALLNEAGVAITMQDARKEAGGELIGRPHIARAIVKKGFASTISEAFEKYIAKGAPYYLDKERLSPQDSIDLIRKGGGIGVLAHPKTLNLKSYDEMKSLLQDLANMGLSGIECYYYSNTKEDEERSLRLARELSLVVTGGTDFHGENKPKVKLGVGLGNMNISEKIFDDLVLFHRQVENGVTKDVHEQETDRL
jgi:predicted metal-dependent phosphoesterase TrpH